VQHPSLPCDSHFFLHSSLPHWSFSVSPSEPPAPLPHNSWLKLLNPLHFFPGSKLVQGPTDASVGLGVGLGPGSSSPHRPAIHSGFVLSLISEMPSLNQQLFGFAPLCKPLECVQHPCMPSSIHFCLHSSAVHPSIPQSSCSAWPKLSHFLEVVNH